MSTSERAKLLPRGARTLARQHGWRVERVESYMAVLAGLREEGLLAGPRFGWTVQLCRPLAGVEAEALAFAAFLSDMVTQHGLVVDWEL